MTRKQQYRQLEQELLSYEQLREIETFDKQMRRSNARFNELVTCESDLNADDYCEYKNFSMDEGADRVGSGE